MIIGVDNGNAQTKTTHVVFPSGAISHDSYPEFSNEVLKFNNKYYTLSSKRSDVKQDKTITIECFVLTLFAIAKEIEYRKEYAPHISVDLGVGLPWDTVQNQKNIEKFKEYFYKWGKDIHFEYNKKEFNITLNSVSVGAQGYAIILDRTNIFKEYNRIFIIDIGGWTIDCLLVTPKGASMEYSLSKPLGVITFMNKVKSRVYQNTSKVIEDIHIMDVIFDRPTVLTDDVKEIIREEAKHYPVTLVNSFKEDNIDLSTNPVVFMGGGSLLLKEYLKNNKTIARAYFVDDISANAAGYETMVKYRLSQNKE